MTYFTEESSSGTWLIIFELSGVLVNQSVVSHGLLGWVRRFSTTEQTVSVIREGSRLASFSVNQSIPSPGASSPKENSSDPHLT